MTVITSGAPKFTEADLDFVVDEVAPGAQNKEHLKQLILEDADFRKALLEDEKVFNRLIVDEEAFLRISTPLYFEVLLRKSRRELETVTHTIERTGRENIPVFDTREVTKLLDQPGILYYLAHLLASFTRINSYRIRMRTPRGRLRLVRYNDMDIDCLIDFCSRAEEEERFAFYKRIADVCLFVSGVFPESASPPFSAVSVGGPRRRFGGGMRRTMEEYVHEGQSFYGLAQQHPQAQKLQLSDVFELLGKQFTWARKPLGFIATNYLHARTDQLFGSRTQ